MRSLENVEGYTITEQRLCASVDHKLQAESGHSKQVLTQAGLGCINSTLVALKGTIQLFFASEHLAHVFSI